jgi:predicted nucleotidyltransferase component of viral defense system
MLEPEYIKNFFPESLRNNPQQVEYIFKEYIQLLILDYLSTSVYLKKINFIGGTNLRLIKGIDRFSEDLDFDCSQLSQTDFNQMTDCILQFLTDVGFRVEARDNVNKQLHAFRRNIYFPELLFNLGLSKHKEKRFLIKIEAQNQNFDYLPAMATVSRCNLLFQFPIPPDDILCAMKLSALLSRKKGRDFYDAIFLLGQTQPNYEYLAAKHAIHNLTELKTSLALMLNDVDLNQKSKDFKHLLFRPENANRILLFKEFVNNLTNGKQI